MKKILCLMMVFGLTSSLWAGGDPPNKKPPADQTHPAMEEEEEKQQEEPEANIHPIAQHDLGVYQVASEYEDIKNFLIGYVKKSSSVAPDDLVFSLESPPPERGETFADKYLVFSSDTPPVSAILGYSFIMLEVPHYRPAYGEALKQLVRPYATSAVKLVVQGPTLHLIHHLFQLDFPKLEKIKLETHGDQCNPGNCLSAPPALPHAVDDIKARFPALRSISFQNCGFRPTIFGPNPQPTHLQIQDLTQRIEEFSARTFAPLCPQLSHFNLWSFQTSPYPCLGKAFLKPLIFKKLETYHVLHSDVPLSSITNLLDDSPQAKGSIYPQSALVIQYIQVRHQACLMLGALRQSARIIRQKLRPQIFQEICEDFLLPKPIRMQNEKP